MGVARVKILIFQLLFYFKKWDKGLAYRELEALKTQLKACGILLICFVLSEVSESLKYTTQSNILLLFRA